MKSLFAIASFAFASYGVLSDVSCKHQDDCENGHYTCEGSGCVISCTGQDSCENSHFTCDTSCTVDCTNEDSCEDSTFDFHGGTVDVYCTDEDACGNSFFKASNGTILIVECEREDACADAAFYLYDTSTLELSCSGNYACDYAVCYCDGGYDCEISGPLECRDMSTAANTIDTVKTSFTQSHGHKRRHQKRREENGPRHHMEKDLRDHRVRPRKH